MTAISRKLYFLKLMIIINALPVSFPPVRAELFPQGASPRFCLVAVKNSALGVEDLGSTFRIVANPFVVDGIPRPVFAPINRRGRWTINDTPALVPYEGLHPKSYLDTDFAPLVEPWSGRAIVGGNPISVKGPNSSDFKEIDIFEKGLSGFVSRPFLLPKRQMTAIIINGEAYEIKGDDLRLLVEGDDSARNGDAALVSIHESNLLGGVVTSDVSGRITFVADSGARQAIGQLQSTQNIRDVVDLPDINTTYVLAEHNIFLLGRSEKSSRHIAVTALETDNEAWLSYPYSQLLKQVVHYDPGSFFSRRHGFQRLGAMGLEAVPGGDILMTDAVARGEPSMKDFATLGKMIVNPVEGIFTYDGVSLSQVKGSGPKELGANPLIYDLTAIGFTLVAADTGLFELRRDNTLAPVAVPFDARRGSGLRLINWPDAGVAVIGTTTGLFTVDSQLRVALIAGTETFKMLFPQDIKPVPGSGELTVYDDHGIDILVDTQMGKLKCR